MDIMHLILKAVGSLTALFFLAKILGKKQMGQLNMYDYIIGISIGNIVAEMSVNKDVVFHEGIIVMSTYALIDFLASLLTAKSIVVRRFLSGTPIIIIENGKLIEKNLKSAKLDINEVLEEARINGYFNLNEIEYAIMESNGRLSFLQKSKFKPLTPDDMKINTSYEGLSPNLIIDGKVMVNNLKYIGKDLEWLHSRIKKLGYNDTSEILLAICDSKENITVYLKDVKQELNDCLE